MPDRPTDDAPKTVTAVDDRTGVGRILDKRTRQRVVHGFTPEHDRAHHTAQEFAAAALALSLYASLALANGSTAPAVVVLRHTDAGWPWDTESWVRAVADGPEEALVNAGALIAALLDRGLG